MPHKAHKVKARSKHCVQYHSYFIAYNYAILHLVHITLSTKLSFAACAQICRDHLKRSRLQKYYTNSLRSPHDRYQLYLPFLNLSMCMQSLQSDYSQQSSLNQKHKDHSLFSLSDINIIDQRSKIIRSQLAIDLVVCILQYALTIVVAKLLLVRSCSLN